MVGDFGVVLSAIAHPTLKIYLRSLIFIKLKRLFILSAVLLTLEACSSVVSKTVAQSSLPPNGAEKPQPPPRIDFAAASRKLGVSEAQ